MRHAGGAMILLLILSGCSSTTTGEDCVSRYEPVAEARTLKALKHELRHDVDPRVRSLKVIDEHPDKGKVYVNLLNRRNRTVMSLDVWRQGDGTWTAQQWSQCID
jgi:hypothetical protein